MNAPKTQLGSALYYMNSLDPDEDISYLELAKVHALIATAQAAERQAQAQERIAAALEQIAAALQVAERDTGDE